jgi:hypothetical protein
VSTDPLHSAEKVRGLFPGMFLGVRRLAWMDAADPADTAGGCELCEVEWQGTFAEVQQQMIAHKHEFLREVRYELDVYPNSFGNQRFMVEQLWHLALLNDGPEGGNDV